MEANDLASQVNERRFPARRAGRRDEASQKPVQVPGLEAGLRDHLALDARQEGFPLSHFSWSSC